MHVTSLTAGDHFGDHWRVFQSRAAVTIIRRVTQDVVLSQSLQRNIFCVTLHFVRNVAARQTDTRVYMFCAILPHKIFFLDSKFNNP